MRFFHVIYLYLIFIVVTVQSCSSGTSFARESEIITDPAFTFTVSPPVRWTYYPRIGNTGLVTLTNFFPGQSVTSAEALQYAQNDVNAAFLEALNEVPIATVGITTSVSYSPDEISNCYIGQTIPGGTRIGYLAGGAVTQISLVSGVSATAVSCPLPINQIQTGIGPYEDYTKVVTVSTRGGTTLSRYTWIRILSQFQSILNYRYQALFRSKITMENI
ncbi:hypothetical protein DICVIV_00746 [Dictyocaulus viviparus]|uniref:Tectonic domain-containing protein n=1 Tax=Dictyocaulus viviparus TaxID=29172 RepID=A0A0D8YEJ7_DICVI|nr:hypothetical protein DICVIV_00746 [Dictyocaulus viviparus]